VIIIVIIPIVFRKSLASLKVFSLFSIFSISYLTIAIIYSYFVITHKEPSKIDIPKETDSSDSESLTQVIFKKFMAISIIIFAYGCQQNIFPLYSELKPSSRSHIPSVIYSAVFFCTMIYLIVGYCGYATFGENVQSNVLNNYADDNVLINIARFAMAIYCTFSYSVQMHPCRDSIKKEIISYKIRHQKDYDDDINEQNSDEKAKLLIDQDQKNYGTVSNASPTSEASTSQSHNDNNLNDHDDLEYEDDDEEDEFESQLDANDADDERSSDHSHQIKHINIDILDNIRCPTNTNIITMNNYDTESLFNYVTLGLLISSYLFAMICDDFGKVNYFFL